MTTSGDKLDITVFDKPLIIVAIVAVWLAAEVTPPPCLETVA